MSSFVRIGDLVLNLTIFLVLKVNTSKQFNQNASSYKQCFVLLYLMSSFVRIGDLVLNLTIFLLLKANTSKQFKAPNLKFS